MDQDIASAAGVLLAIVIVFVAVAVILGIAIKFNDFTHELDYINLEIRRTTGKEQLYWKRQKRRLWLKLLPFYRR